MDTTTTTTAKAVAEFEAQGAIEPGTEGWWKVWGARPHNVRPGDLVLTSGHEWSLIEDTFAAKAAPVRVGWVADGERFTMGAGVPIILLRWGTRHTLVEA